MGKEAPFVTASTLSGDSQSWLSKSPHSLGVEEVIQELKSNDTSGLSQHEATARLHLYGQNALDEGPGVQPIKILINQIANAMMLVSVSLNEGKEILLIIDRC